MALTGGDLNVDQTEIIEGLHSFVDSAVRPMYLTQNSNPSGGK